MISRVLIFRKYFPIENNDVNEINTNGGALVAVNNVYYILEAFGIVQETT